MNQLWSTVLGVGVALLLAWLALVIALVVARPSGNVITESLRLMPDLLRLVARLARDQRLPGNVRLRLGLLLAYLAFPLDLIPDFVPVLGYADDVIAVLWTLRSVIRAVGEEPIRCHWSGTRTGCEVLLRLAKAKKREASPPDGTGGPDGGLDFLSHRKARLDRRGLAGAAGKPSSHRFRPR